MVSYTLPGMTEFSDINLLFLSFYRDARDIFFDDVRIESVYGGFAGSALCGGRNNVGEQKSLVEVGKLIARYNDLGVACNATFTNQFATCAVIEGDRYGREIARLLAEARPQQSGAPSPSATAPSQPPDARPGNGVIVFTDDMESYARRELPALRLISSTTKEILETLRIEEELDRFDRVVLNYNLTHDEQAIRALSRPEKLEVMVNEYCTLGCPYRRAHYRRTSKCQLEGRPCDFQCRHKPAPQAWGFLNGLVEGDVFLKNDAVRRYASELGVGSFKIVGRGLSRYDVIDSYLYYLVKPEHWYEVRDYLVHRGYL